MPNGTTYKPVRVQDFESSKLLHNGMSAQALVPAGTSANIDLVFTDDHLLTGVWAIMNDGAYGDKVSIQVYDVTGAFTGTAGTVLNQFITDWYVPATMCEQFDIPYPAKILGGMGLRAVYTSTGVSNVFVAMNFKLHKVLV